MKTTNQMFGKLARQLAAEQQGLRDEIAERQRRVDQEQARLDETLTRREVLEALENVVNEFGGAGFPENDAIATAFRKLAEALS